MPVIQNQTTAAAATTTTTTITTTNIDEIENRTATTQSTTHKSKQKPNTANNIQIAATTSGTAKTTTSTNTNNSSRQQQQQQQKQKHKQPKSINDSTTTKRRKHYYNNSSQNKHRKHKISLAKSVPATPVQVNPITTNNFVPSSPDFYDDNDVDDDVLYMPPYSYPACSLDILNGDYAFDNEFTFKAAQSQQLGQKQVVEEKNNFREALAGNHPLELPRDTEDDSSSMAMITPPPPYDTPYTKQLQLYPYSSAQRYPQHQAAYTAPKAQHSHNTPHTRKYIFNNNREQFNISSSNGNSSSNSIQQQPHSSSLGSTLTNAITPTKLSAAAAAMFAAPQMVQLNRKWSNLHRKRRRRNSSSGDSKELDKLVLQSVDWDENDIY